MEHYAAFATAAVRWFMALSFQTVIICLTFVVSTAMALWDSLKMFSGANADWARFDNLK
jgi:hypothetical protein